MSNLSSARNRALPKKDRKKVLEDRPIWSAPSRRSPQIPRRNHDNKRVPNSFHKDWEGFVLKTGYFAQPEHVFFFFIFYFFFIIFFFFLLSRLKAWYLLSLTFSSVFPSSSVYSFSSPSFFLSSSTSPDLQCNEDGQVAPNEANQQEQGFRTKLRKQLCLKMGKKRVSFR